MDVADHMVDAATGSPQEHNFIAGKGQGPVPGKLCVGLVLLRLMLLPHNIRILAEVFPDFIGNRIKIPHNIIRHQSQFFHGFQAAIHGNDLIEKGAGESQIQLSARHDQTSFHLFSASSKIFRNAFTFAAASFL